MDCALNLLCLKGFSPVFFSHIRSLVGKNHHNHKVLFLLDLILYSYGRDFKSGKDTSLVFGLILCLHLQKVFGNYMVLFFMGQNGLLKTLSRL